MHFNTLIADRGMVEDDVHVREDLLDGYVRVFPRIQHAGSDELEDFGCEVACWFIQEVAEVVFGEHGVCGVGGVGVCPHFVLVLSGGINHAFATTLQRLGDGVENGADEGGEEREDEDGECFNDLLDEGFEAWNLLDDGGDGAHDFVAEGEDGIDLGDEFGGVDVGGEGGVVGVAGLGLLEWVRRCLLEGATTHLRLRGGLRREVGLLLPALWWWWLLVGLLVVALVLVATLRAPPAWLLILIVVPVIRTRARRAVVIRSSTRRIIIVIEASTAPCSSLIATSLSL